MKIAARNFKRKKSSVIRPDKSGQNATEYLLLVAVVSVVALIGLNMQGFFTNAIDQSLNLGVKGLEEMADSVSP